MKNAIAVGLLLIVIPLLGLTQDAGRYQCSFGELQRRVEILTEPGVSVPCEVHYYKDTEAPGEKQVLWSAGNQEGYCEIKTEEFIGKLEGWGWDCGQSSDAMPASEAKSETAPETDVKEETEEAPPAYDDTDVLSPGNPSD